MPTYEYACKECGVVEAFQRMSDDPLTDCPECGKSGVSRIVSGGAGVIFKGDGFFETDYNRSADYKKSAAKDSGESPCAAGGTCPAKEAGVSCPAASD
ncbi:MAG: FmdB family zinc ribbon protein [Planctomycetota bacterium]